MTNTDVVTQWFEQVWNQKKASAIPELLSDTCIAHGLTDENGNELTGVAPFTQFYNKFVASFPDASVKILHTATEGDKVATLTEFTMPHTGKSFEINASKSITPSGKPLKMVGVAFTIVRDGKIQEAWNCYDFLGFFTQMGAFE